MVSTAVRRRWMVLLALLAGAAWLAAFGDKTPIGSSRRESSQVADVVLPARRVPMGPQSSVENGRLPMRGESVEAIIPRQSFVPQAARPGVDLFAPPTWHVASPRGVQVPRVAPQAASSVLPAAAQAPEPGYRVIGKKQEAGRWEVYLDREDASHVARVGEIIESAWRVERIAPPTMTLMHLPTGQERHVGIGEPR